MTERHLQGVPKTDVDSDGRTFIISAATKHGVPYADAMHEAEYLQKIGFSVRFKKIGDYYYVYGRLRK